MTMLLPVLAFLFASLLCSAGAVVGDMVKRGQVRLDSVLLATVATGCDLVGSSTPDLVWGIHGTAVAGIIVFGSLMGAMFIGQQFLQNVLSYDPLEAGASILPAALLMVFVAPRSAKLVDARGARFTLLLGNVFCLRNEQSGIHQHLIQCLTRKGRGMT